MKRCKARNSDNWRCIRLEHEGDDHGYSFVDRIRLPKSRMRLLHALRAALVRVEGEIINEGRTNFLLTSLKARDELISAIEELEEWGQKLFQEHQSHEHGERHWGHKVCFYTPEGTCLDEKKTGSETTVAEVEGPRNRAERRARKTRR